MPPKGRNAGKQAARADQAPARDAGNENATVAMPFRNQPGLKQEVLVRHKAEYPDREGNRVVHKEEVRVIQQAKKK